MELSFSVSWYLPKRVLYARIHHQLEQDESAQIDNLLCTLLDEGEDVYLIMDLREIKEMKNPNLARLDHTVSYRRHPHLQWMLILANDRLMRFLSSTVSRCQAKPTSFSPMCPNWSSP